MGESVHKTCRGAYGKSDEDRSLAETYARQGCNDVQEKLSPKTIGQLMRQKLMLTKSYFLGCGCLHHYFRLLVLVAAHNQSIFCFDISYFLV